MDNQEIQAETDARQLVNDYVETSPFKLNLDTIHVDKIVKSLAKKKIKFGEYYCPCRMMTKNKEMDAKIICPCVYHVEEIEKDGICSCDLFVSENYTP